MSNCICFKECTYYYEWDYGVCILFENGIVDTCAWMQYSWDAIECPYYEHIDDAKKRITII